ncbi:hypothetical protein Syun_023008 [Stephania yunnanensis]|uniref:Uncharacterized protein n=1 Tax=Stephania yunnanensis TaxID=152371 RepID=A0AAP0FGD7_9MAGN
MELLYSVFDPSLISKGSEMKLLHSVSDPSLISNGSETKLLHSISDPSLISNGSETELLYYVSDPFMFSNGSEKKYNNSAPHKPSPSSAISVLPRRRLLCPLPSSALSLTIICFVLASPIDDRRLHLVPDVDDHGLFVLKCERMGIALPGLTLAQQFYLSVKAHGEGRLGTQALLLAFERLNGIRVDTSSSSSSSSSWLHNELQKRRARPSISDPHMVLSGVKHNEKKQFVSELQKKKNVVVMVGDGINDVFALHQADVGVAMGGGVGAASEVSSVVLMGNRLSQYQRQQCEENTSFFFLKMMKYTLEPESDHLNVVVGCFGAKQIDNEDSKAKSLVGICI